jgi:GMP synthase-like glutamine amidotransferase
MNIHIIQHVPFEKPGALSDWAESRGHRIQIVDPTQCRFPSSDETDFLIVLGGPMSVHDEAEFPWLRLEKETLRKFIADKQKPLLGICLGAQLIATVLGAKVYRNTQKEIGWFDVNIKPCGIFKNSSVAAATVFHWHGEAFELPFGAELLASSQVTPVQAFQYGDKVVALQFHPEMNFSALQDLLHECAEWIQPREPFEQSESLILKKAQTALPQSVRFLEQILDGLVGK